MKHPIGWAAESHRGTFRDSDLGALCLYLLTWNNFLYYIFSIFYEKARAVNPKSMACNKAEMD